MKFLIPALAAVATFAAQAASPATPEQAELRAECAKSYSDTSSAAMPMAANEYQFVYSGGKFLRGPQTSGLLLGRKDLVQAAWRNASPMKCASLCRSMIGSVMNSKCRRRKEE